MLRDKEINNLIDELYNTLSGAITYADQKSEHPELLQELLDATYNFSGFKTFHQMNETGFLLESKDSDIISYQHFKEQSKKIDDKYNETYLQTEYQLFAESARMANKWAEIEADGDRYDLQYRTAHDEKVREEHRKLEGTTLPPSDPFWDSYYPPNGYNCRCTVEQVRKGKYPRSNSKTAIDIGNAMTEGKKSIFRFNPGKTKSPYPKNHPYMPTENCAECDSGLNLKWKKNSQACAVCKILAQCAADKKKSEAAIQRKHFLHEMKSLTGNKVTKEVAMTNGNKRAISVGFTTLGNKHLYYDANSIFKADIEFLTSLDKNLTNASVGYEVKLHKVRKDDIKRFYYFDSSVNNTDVTLMVAEDIYKEKSGKKRLIRYLYSIKKR